MAESPKIPKDSSKADTSKPRTDSSRVVRTVPKTDKPPGETAKASDSVPMPGGPFTVLPTKFGRYQILKELGRGQMGAVYLAQDTELDRPVALKVARTSSSGSAKLLKRMEVEAKAAAIVDHPHICKVFDAGEIDGIRFIALQYVEGEDLKKFLKRTGRQLLPKEAIRIVVQILRALQAAHEKGIIHRDLKPENVMLNKNSEPMIMDFGLARRSIGSSDAGLTQGMVVGTAAYMSPEQALGKAEGIDHRSDIYAVGVMLFEMLTGTWPFTGGAIEVMGKKCVQPAPSPLDLSPDLAPPLAAVCHKMIAQKKEERYATCVEVIESLEAIHLTASAEESTPTIAPEPEPVFNFQTTERLSSRLRKNSKILSEKQEKPKSSSGLLANFWNWWNRRPPVVRWSVPGGGGACLIALAAMIFLPTPDGLLQIEINDPTLNVQFDGSVITLAQSGDVIRVSPTTKHTLEVIHDGITVDSLTREIALKKGEKQIVKVTLVDGNLIVGVNGTQVATTTVTPHENRVSHEEDTSNTNPVVDGGKQPPPQNSPPSAKPATVSGSTPDADALVESRDGFVPLFNGRDLTGWSVDGGKANQWSVQGSEILGHSDTWRTRSYLLTNQEFADCVLRFEFQIDGPNSHGGIAIRSITGEHVPLNNKLIFDHPVIKLFNRNHGKERFGTAHWIESAAAYVPPLTELELTPPSWTRMEVTVQGEHCSAKVGDTTIVDLKLKPGKAVNFVPALARSKGRIGFQINTGIVRFRNIEIKELHEDPKDQPTGENRSNLPRNGIDDGWRPVFDGKTFDGWTTWIVSDATREVRPGKGVEWAVSNGEIVCETESMGWLQLDKKYGDCEFDFEFFLPAGTNSGLILRYPGMGYAFGKDAFEVQLENDPSQTRPEQQCGAIYDVVAPQKSVFVQGEWNRMAVRLQKKEIGIRLNDKSVVNVVTSNHEKLRNFPTTGCFCLINNIARAKGCRFKNIRVRVLSSGADAESTNQAKSKGEPPRLIAPFDVKSAKLNQKAWANYLELPVDLENSIGMKFVLVPPGEFTMGSPKSEIEEALRFANKNEKWKAGIKSCGPQHKVVLTRPVYIGVHEVTQGHYSKVMGENPSHFTPTGKGKDSVLGMITTNHPVENVSWDNVTQFCAKLGDQEQKASHLRSRHLKRLLGGSGYRLPTNAEWEFACRAGTTTTYWSGSREDQLCSVDWVSTNSGKRTHAVGELRANPFGLHDLHGNVAEWVQDIWLLTYYGQFQETKAIDPAGPITFDSQKIIRLGDWNEPPIFSRASDRDFDSATHHSEALGFRIVLAIP